MNLQTKYIILGGGISGLSAGLKLAQSGCRTALIEKESIPGGLAGTVRQMGCQLDFGPHSFFTEDSEVDSFVQALFSENELVEIPRDVKFRFRGKYLNYPFTAPEILSQLPAVDIFKILLDFIFAKAASFQKSKSSDESSVEDWAKSNFGDHLYQVFFKPYTEQFWKRSCRELSARSIPTHTRLSFVSTLKHLLRGKSLDKQRTSLTQLDREKLPTFYPRGGYGEIAHKMEALFLNVGGSVTYSAEADLIQLTNENVTVHFLQNGVRQAITGERLISTLPLQVLLSMISPEPPAHVIEAASKLNYRPLIFLGVLTNKPNPIPSSYIYVLDRPYNRLTNMNRFSPKAAPPGSALLGVEIPVGSVNDPLWSFSSEELLQHCLPALIQDGVISNENVKGLLLAKNPFAYPVYTTDYKKHLEVVLNWIQIQSKLISLGRLGEFKYMDADQCIRGAFNKVEEISASRGLFR